MESLYGCAHKLKMPATAYQVWDSWLSYISYLDEVRSPTRFNVSYDGRGVLYSYALPITALGLIRSDGAAPKLAGEPAELQGNLSETLNAVPGVISQYVGKESLIPYKPVIYGVFGGSTRTTNDHSARSLRICSRVLGKDSFFINANLSIDPDDVVKEIPFFANKEFPTASCTYVPPSGCSIAEFVCHLADFHALLKHCRRDYVPMIWTFRFLAESVFHKSKAAKARKDSMISMHSSEALHCLNKASYMLSLALPGNDINTKATLKELEAEIKLYVALTTIRS